MFCIFQYLRIPKVDLDTAEAKIRAMAADSTWQTNRAAANPLSAASASAAAGSAPGADSSSPTASAQQKTYDRFIELDDLMEFCMEMWVREDFHLGAQLTRALGERLLARAQKDRFGIALMPLAGPSYSGSGSGTGGNSGSGGNSEVLAANAATPLGVTQFAFSHAASLQSGAAAAELANAAAAAAASATNTEILQSPGSGSGIGSSSASSGASAGASSTPAPSGRRAAIDSAAGIGVGPDVVWSKVNMARCTLDAFAAVVAPMAPHWVQYFVTARGIFSR